MTEIRHKIVEIKALRAAEMFGIPEGSVHIVELCGEMAVSPKMWMLGPRAYEIIREIKDLEGLSK